jgi:hypothetical protein
MNKKVLIALLAVAAAALALGGGPAAADPDSNQGASGLTDPLLLALISNDDLFATADLTTVLSSWGGGGIRHYGPYPSSSPDSGTCGNDWATDMFDREFTVRGSGGTLTVVQQFKRGSFVTMAGPSPGSCDLDDGSPPGTVDGGVTGTMHGYFIIPLPPGTVQTSTDPSCVAGMPAAPCTTAGFINSHFSPACYPATCPVTTFSFSYTAPDQGLDEHHWKNASDDRGGNLGDIRSTTF